MVKTATTSRQPRSKRRTTSPRPRATTSPPEPDFVTTPNGSFTLDEWLRFDAFERHWLKR
jgi:hypothetical protein